MDLTEKNVEDYCENSANLISYRDDQGRVLFAARKTWESYALDQSTYYDLTRRELPFHLKQTTSSDKHYVDKFTRADIDAKRGYSSCFNIVSRSFSDASLIKQTISITPIKSRQSGKISSVVTEVIDSPHHTVEGWLRIYYRFFSYRGGNYFLRLFLANLKVLDFFASYPTIREALLLAICADNKDRLYASMALDVQEVDLKELMLKITQKLKKGAEISTIIKTMACSNYNKKNAKETNEGIFERFFS